MRQVAFPVLIGAAVLLGTEVLGAGASSAPADKATNKVETRAAFSSARTGPSAVGVDADVYCSGWLGETDEKFVGAVVSAEKIDTQSVFGFLDLVYVNIGEGEGAKLGQEYWVCRPDTLVTNPNVPERTIGRVYTTPARIRITCVKEKSSIAEIVAACNEVEIGDVLLPFEPIPIPLVRRTRVATLCDVPNGKVTGQIVHARDSAVAICQHSIVFLNRGEKDGLAPGDFLTVFRTRTGAGSVRTLLGEAAILVTKDHSAVARIMVSKDAMGVGDEVELK
jgi:hypothetical protein